MTQLYGAERTGQQMIAGGFSHVQQQQQHQKMPLARCEASQCQFMDHFKQAIAIVEA